MADMLENEDNMDDIESFLPPRQVIGPDEDGIKKVIEHKLRGNGEMVKLTTTYRVHKVVTKKSKRAIERRSWPKFGDAVNDKANSGLNLVSSEEVFLEGPGIKGKVKAEDDALGQLGNRGGSLRLCRTCGEKGGHFTFHCPYKDHAQQSEALNYKQPSSADGAAASSKANSNNIYVPPSMRKGAKKSIETDIRSRNEGNSTIWIGNLSLDAQESDLDDLCSLFGPIRKIRIATDHRTGVSKGHAYVSFFHKVDAERAINMLNGYGYDNLILKVEWTWPR